MNLEKAFDELFSPVKQSDFLTRFRKTLSGTPDDLLSEGEMSQRTKRRKDASGMAKSAMDDQGESYMDAPAIGGSGKGLGDLLKTVVGLFK